MEKTQLSNATLELDAANSLKLDWSPEGLSFTGFSLDTVSLGLDDSGVGVKASGTLSMSVDGITCAVPANWMAGLGAGSFSCDLILTGNIEVTTGSSQTLVKLSKLTTSVMGNALGLMDISLNVDCKDLDNLTDSVKAELEKEETGLFNKFWTSQVTNGAQVLTDDFKDKTASLDFEALNLSVSNDIIATSGGKGLTTEKSTLTGSLTCTWKYTGVALSLKASMTFFGKATSVNASSNSASDLAKLSTWVTTQVTQLYQNPSQDSDWLEKVEVLLRSQQLDVIDTFKEKGYISWIPGYFTVQGFVCESTTLSLTDNGVGIKASGTISMSIDKIASTVSANWMTGLGQGSFSCELVLTGSIEISALGTQSTVNLSKLTASVMGNVLSFSDMSFKIDNKNLNNLADSVRTELEKTERGLFNKFWTSQVTNSKQVLTYDFKDKTASLDFNALNLAVSNDIIADSGGKALITEKSVMTGSLSCTWNYSGVTLSLKASMTFFGKATSVNVTSNSASDLSKLSTWVAAQGTDLYKPLSYDRDWLRSIGVFLHSKGLDVAKTFKAQGYSATTASQAVDGPYQGLAGKVLGELYLAGYATNDLLDAMRYGIGLTPRLFASTFKNTLHWGYRTVGIRMKSVGFSAIDIAEGLNQSVFACTMTDIARLFQHPEYGYMADDFDGASGALINIIKSHLSGGKSKGGGGFFKGPPGPKKP
ncbi:MAG: hypothetical protein HEP71_03345 [Roseivirga sp.]|nr:hypothetical protein [Roseivirga sp.]